LLLLLPVTFLHATHSKFSNKRNANGEDVLLHLSYGWLVLFLASSNLVCNSSKLMFPSLHGELSFPTLLLDLHATSDDDDENFRLTIHVEHMDVSAYVPRTTPHTNSLGRFSCAPFAGKLLLQT